MSQHNPSKTKAFKSLQVQWYRKLEKSGFKDIENGQEHFTDHQNVVQFSQRIHFKSGIKDLCEEYYLWATHMAHNEDFLSLRDKVIWFMHAEGHSGSEIALTMRLERTWVNKEVRRIKAYLIKKASK